MINCNNNYNYIGLCYSGVLEVLVGFIWHARGCFPRVPIDRIPFVLQPLIASSNARFKLETSTFLTTTMSNHDIRVHPRSYKLPAKRTGLNSIPTTISIWTPPFFFVERALQVSNSSQRLVRNDVIRVWNEKIDFAQLLQLYLEDPTLAYLNLTEGYLME